MGHGSKKKTAEHKRKMAAKSERRRIESEGIVQCRAEHAQQGTPLGDRARFQVKKPE